jgi:hypothetical protein
VVGVCGVLGANLELEGEDQDRRRCSGPAELDPRHAVSAGTSTYRAVPDRCGGEGPDDVVRVRVSITRTGVKIHKWSYSQVIGRNGLNGERVS